LYSIVAIFRSQACGLRTALNPSCGQVH